MKRLSTIILSILCVANVTAQQNIPDTHLTSNVVAARRTEITLPKVNGYTCYKADFHTHTMFSDADLTPRQRVRERFQSTVRHAPGGSNVRQVRST